MIESEFYNVKEAAEMLRMKTPTVRLWVREGKLRSVKISTQKILIPREDVRALIDNARAKASR
jgi:excisionase family DNA binding protein